MSGASGAGCASIARPDPRAGLGEPRRCRLCRQLGFDWFNCLFSQHSSPLMHRMPFRGCIVEDSGSCLELHGFQML